MQPIIDALDAQILLLEKQIELLEEKTKILEMLLGKAEKRELRMAHHFVVCPVTPEPSMAIWKDYIQRRTEMLERKRGE